MAGEERVELLSLPGGEEGGQGEFALGSLLGAGAATDLSADHQGTQGAFGGIVVRGDVGVGHEGKEFLDEVGDATA